MKTKSIWGIEISEDEEMLAEDLGLADFIEEEINEDKEKNTNN